MPKAPPSDARHVQYAALAWRAAVDGERELLLATSRDTRRWVIPKGWPISGLAPQESAAREAYEEAGVTGRADPAPLGVYPYEKSRKDGRRDPVEVTVFS